MKNRHSLLLPALPSPAILLLLFFCASHAVAQRPVLIKPNAPKASAPAMRFRYNLAFPQPHTHLYEITFTLGPLTAPRLELALPVWTPGSYLVREYARHVQDFSVRDEAGQVLKWDKSDKAALQVIEANKIQVVVPDDKFLETVRSKGLEKPWLEAAKKIGVDGPALLKAFQQDIARSESSR